MSTPLPLYIQLLGNFRLMAGDDPVISVNTPRLQALLAYLVLHRMAPQLRQHLAFQLWPDSSESQARTNLRKLLFQLQRALPHAAAFLRTDTQSIQWMPTAPGTSDVTELQQWLKHLETEPLDLAALRRVVELYQGELLPSCYDDWIVPIRQQLHQAVMGVLERLITLLENQRAYEEGIRYAQRLLLFDVLEEKTYQRLMQLHALDGDYTAALRVYQECVAILQRELDVEPDPETLVLYERLRQRDATLVAKVEHKLPQAKIVPLVGRQLEWQTLQNCWRLAVRGQTHFSCIWGEAGIGKTRLAEELLAWAQQQGILTARTRAYQPQGALAYAPIIELLRSGAMQPRLDRLSEPWRGEVARLLPELLATNSPLPPILENWQRQRFFEALARAVIVDNQPLLLVFDDLHWCDPETLAWLHYLLHYSPAARLLVIATSRVEEVDDAHPLTNLRLSLHREALITEIELAPLSADEVATLASEIADQDLSREQVAQIYIDTEGNPLFVVETIHAALQGQVGTEEPEIKFVSSTLNTSSSAMTPKVHAVIRWRLLQLSPSTQKIVGLAAVIGRSFTFDVLMAAAHVDEDTLIDSLDELGTRRILREQAVNSYDFSHDHIREVAYTELSRARRRQLHRHVAEALQTVYVEGLDEISGALAEHYEQAGNYSEAIHYLQRTASWASQVYAYREAVSYYNRALILVSTVENNLSNQNHQQQITLLIKIADSYISLENFNEAQRFYYESLDLARTQESTQSLADSLRGLGAVAYHQSEYTKAIPLNQQALQIYREMGNRSREANVLSQLGSINHYQGDLEKAVQLYEQALSITKEIGEQSEEAHILSGLGLIACAQGEYKQANKLYQQASTTYRELGNRSREAHTLNKLGDIAFLQGENAKGDDLYQQALTMYRSIGARGGEAGVLFDMGITAYEQGEYARAIQLYQQASTTYRDLGNRRMEAHTLIGLGVLLFTQGEYAKAASLHQQTLEIFLSIGDRMGKAITLTNLGDTTCAQGEYTKASQLYQQALTIFREIWERGGQVDALLGLGDIACTQGEYTKASQLYQQALAITKDLGVQNMEARSLTSLGWAATEQNEYIEAIPLLQQALEITKKLGERGQEAKALHYLGSVACGQKELQVARQYFTQSLSISQDIGLTPVLLASLVGIAQVFIQENEKEQALQLIALTLHAPQATAYTKKQATLLITELQTVMPPKLVTTLLQAGEQLKLIQVVADILQANK